MLGGPFQAAFGGAQFDRTKQINEVLVAVPHCKAVNPERSLLEVGILLRDGTTTSLRISLPAGFPRDRPAMAVTSPVRHTWVDPKTGRLSFPLLDHWGQYGARLAVVVQEALKGLGGAPAPVPSAAAPASHPAVPMHAQPGHPQPHAAAAAAAAAAAPPSSGAGLPPPRPQMPPLPRDFPQLLALTNEELSEALCDEGAYCRLVESVTSGLRLDQAVDEARRATRDLAQANLEKEEQMADIRNQIAIVNSEYAPAKAGFEERHRRQEAVLSQLAPEVLMARLQAATAVADEESGMLVHQLEAGQVPLEGFVDRYVRARAVYYQRDLKYQAARHTIPTHG